MTGIDHVLWIGGGCGAGKTTLARRLAYRFDLRFYPVDAYGYTHEARATPRTHPRMSALAALDFHARHVAPGVEERIEQFVSYATERFGMVLDDLAELADGPLVVAEGPFLLPELVAPVLTDRRRAVWLLPTPEFTDRNVTGRAEPAATRDESDRQRAHRLRLARDAELTARMRRDTARLGLAAVEVDGSLGIAESEQMLATRFAPLIGAGRRARTGDERASMRRAENAVAVAQISAFLASLGDAAPPELTPFPYGCECTTLGCAAQVPMTLNEYRAAGAALAPH